MASNAELIAVWMDKTIGEEGACEQLKTHFRTVSTAISRWIYVDNDDRLFDVVTRNPIDKIVLIISGSAAQRMLGLISQHQNLHSVYLFCGRKTRYVGLANGEPKVRGIYDIEDELFEAMKRNLTQEFP